MGRPRGQNPSRGDRYASERNNNVSVFHGDGLSFAGERFGLGDGERKRLLKRQIAFEPLPASVLFGLGWFVCIVKASRSSE